jgi:hypothetical protein
LERLMTAAEEAAAELVDAIAQVFAIYGAAGPWPAPALSEPTPGRSGERLFLPTADGRLAEVLQDPRPPLGPPPRDLDVGAETRQRQRERFLERFREHGPAIIRELRACATEFRAIGGELKWQRDYPAALAAGRIIHGLLISGLPKKGHHVVLTSGLEIPGLVPALVGHDPSQRIGTARASIAGSEAFCEILVDDSEIGRAAAEHCRTGVLWACSAFLEDVEREPRAFGGTTTTRSRLGEVSLVADPNDWRCRCAVVGSYSYDSFARDIGIVSVRRL